MHASLLSGVAEPEWEGYESDQMHWTLELLQRPVTAPLTVILWASEAECPRLVPAAILAPFDSRIDRPCTATTGTRLDVLWALPRVLDDARDTVTVIVPRQVGTLRLVAHGKEWGRWSPYRVTNAADRPMRRIVVGDTVRLPCHAVLMPEIVNTSRRGKGRASAPPPASSVADTLEVPCGPGQAPGTVRIIAR